MTDLVREIRFCLNERVVRWTLLTAILLSGLSVINGQLAVKQQEAQLGFLKAETAEDQSYVLPSQGDPGSAAYYIFHLTYDPPSDLAFAALGMRDELPWKHRVRMLALEGQIYENDPGNPELSYLGKLDFAYLVSILLPLMLIGLLYDLNARERRESRLELLYATSQKGERVLLYRALARALLLFASLIIPFLVAVILTAAPVGLSLNIAIAVFLHILFWLGVSRIVARNTNEGVTAAVTLFGIWLVLTSIVPVIGKYAAERLSRVPDGGEILLVQRETVNDAWDLPKDATMDPFIERHPEWQGQKVDEEAFDWMWYYAFQQVGDQVAEPLSDALNRGIADRDRFMGMVSFVSPPLLVDRWLSRAAKTDVAQHLQYVQCVRDFHSELRHFHYPMLFNEEPYSQDKMMELPQFTPCGTHH